MTNLVRNNPPTDATVPCSIDAKCGRVTACGTCPSSARSHWARVFSESTRALLTGVGHVDVHNTSPRSPATVLGHTRRRIKRYSAKQSTHIPLNFISNHFYSCSTGGQPVLPLLVITRPGNVVELYRSGDCWATAPSRKKTTAKTIFILLYVSVTYRREIMVSAGRMQRYR